MDIREYYAVRAKESVNASIAALIPVFLLIFPSLLFFSDGKIVLLSIPFFVCSFYFYQLSLVHMRHKIQCADVKKKDFKGILPGNGQFLLAFLPSPSLKAHFFHPEGYPVGKIEDFQKYKIRWFLPYFLDKLIFRKYGLYDENGNLLYIFHRGLRQTVIADVNGRAVAAVVRTAKNYWYFPQLNKKFYAKKELTFTDIKILNGNGEVLGRIRKGWMPLSWGRYFKNPNTPVLTVHRQLPDKERLVFMAIFIDLFRYTDH